MRAAQSKTILIIESDEAHRMQISSYFDENVAITLIIKENIRSAIAHLETIQREPLALPDLLLVNDKSLTDERQVLLHELQKRNLRAYIPVIVLSDTDDKKAVDEAYDYGVASYLVKPTDPKEWHSLFSILIRYWFNEVTLPNYSVARHG